MEWKEIIFDEETLFIVSQIVVNHSLTMDEILELADYSVDDDGQLIDNASNKCIDAWYDNLSCTSISKNNIEDAQVISEKLRNAQEWDLQLCRKLCELADIEDLWDEVDGDHFEKIVNFAAKILEVEI